MDIQDIKTKIKGIFDICVDFVIKNRRYFLAGCIFIGMALLLFLGTSPKSGSSKSSTPSSVTKKFKTKNSDELVKLINDYYTAYAAGDTDTLSTIATPVSDQEVSYIQFYSQYIESFNDIKIFTKQGLTEDSYLVSTEVNVKYTDIETQAPGLDFFYVETNEDGKLYINNTYGSFNQNNNIYEMDAEISDLISVYIRQQDLLDMEADIAKAYDEALASDDSLNVFFSETLPAAHQQWHKDYEEQVAAAEAEAAKKEEEEAAAAEEEAEKQAQAEEEANSYSGTVNSRANVRESADKESDKLGSIDKGTSITIYGEEGDFYKFDYEGKKAYITKDAVTVSSDDSTETTEETSEDESTTAGSLAEGTEVTLTSTVNIRSQMDSSASKVAVAYAGEKVTVVMSYAEGWTKVKYGKKEGYIRTDLLK